ASWRSRNRSPSQISGLSWSDSCEVDVNSVWRKRPVAVRPSALEGASPMNRGRAFWCPVVSEAVVIRLKRSGRLGMGSGPFVQCNQADCQYVEENKPPCPLHPGMFDDEIRAAEAERVAGRNAETQ